MNLDKEYPDRPRTTVAVDQPGRAPAAERQHTVPVEASAVRGRPVNWPARMSVFLFLTAFFWVALFCDPVQFWIFDLEASLAS